MITDDLVRELADLSFLPPVALVYNPLVYARGPWDRYLELYGVGKREIVLLGMNPGPFGMAQTGVPFGDVGMVRDWMGIEEEVGKPGVEHPKRPVSGFDCPKGEVSGKRLWGWARDRFGRAEDFFSRFFVANYCPLCFMEEGGKNRTPDKLKRDERDALFVACDRALRRTVEYLEPKYVVGIGKFAEDRINAALPDLDIKTGRILHPSPASPVANRGWAPRAEADFDKLGITI